MTPVQRTRIEARIRECITRIERHYGADLGLPEVTFDLAGASAGQYRYSRHEGRATHRLRFNPYILVSHFLDGLASTIPHEVAHFAVATFFPRHRLRPHGPEWQEVMQVLGARPERTHSFGLEGLPVRRQQRWHYRCECMDHAVSTTRHNRMLQGARYLCRGCGQPLVLVDPADRR